MTGAGAATSAAGDGRPARDEGGRDVGHDDGAAERTGERRAGADGSISALEWVVAALGGVLVLAVLVFLLWQAVGGADGPPDVSVSVTGVNVQRDGFHVGFEARNDGPSTAMTLAVAAVLTTPGGEVERLESVLDYLPAHSSRRGGFVFAGDPRQGRLEIRAVSYQEP